MKLTVAELAEKLGADLAGDPDIRVDGVADLENAREGTVVWVEKKRFLAAALESAAAAIIAGEDTEPGKKPVLRVANPRLAYARAARIFHPPRQFDPGVSPQATVDATAVLGENVTVQAHAVIEAGAAVGARSVIQAGAFIGQGSQVGNDCRIYPHVTVNENIVIGDRCIIHAGAVIGGDGFGFTPDERGHQVKIPQIGRVVIEDDVEIGANTTIDRATFGDTVIRRGVKLDNLVQIAHNDDIGENTVMAAQVGIAGSTKVGRSCAFGGQVGIADHVEIGDRVLMGGKTGIAAKKKIASDQILLGAPARTLSETKKLFALENRLLKQAAKNEAPEGA